MKKIKTIPKIRLKPATHYVKIKKDGSVVHVRRRRRRVAKRFVSTLAEAEKIGKEIKKRGRWSNVKSTPLADIEEAKKKLAAAPKYTDKMAELMMSDRDEKGVWTGVTSIPENLGLKDSLELLRRRLDREIETLRASALMCEGVIAFIDDVRTKL